MSQQHTYMSWADHTHHRLVIEPNTIGIHVDRCDRKLKYLVATCSSINKNIDQQYECRPLQNRSKRNISDKSKRSLYVFVFFVIGIPCLLIGIIIGIATTVYVSMKRHRQREEQQSQQRKPHPMIKSLSTNNETSQRLKQNTIPTFSSTQGHPLIQRERAIQQPSISNLAYMKSKVTIGNKSKNLLTSKLPLRKQYKNVNNNNTNSSCIRESRSKSC